MSSLPLANYPVMDNEAAAPDGATSDKRRPAISLTLLTRRFSYRSDKMSRLGATVRIDRMPLSMRNKEFSGGRELGARFAYGVCNDTSYIDFVLLTRQTP
jgi:hypothetical protein